MIDRTARVFGKSKISSLAYVGPFCVVGFPSTMNLVPASLFSSDDNLSSAGAAVEEKAVLLSHVVIGEKSEIGRDVWCDHHTYIGVETVIMDNAAIMYGARIYDRVRIGEDSWVAGFVCNDAVVERSAIVLGSLVHRFVDATEGDHEAAPIVREGAFIGMGASVIGGIEVGAGAYIGAGAVLTRSARPGYLYLGNPAREKGRAPRPFREENIE